MGKAGKAHVQHGEHAGAVLAARFLFASELVVHAVPKMLAALRPSSDDPIVEIRIHHGRNAAPK
jgi:hypothetical protein